MIQSKIRGAIFKPKEKEGREFDLHVWIKPETEDMQALVTVSGNGACYDLTIDHAARWFQDLLEQEAESFGEVAEG